MGYVTYTLLFINIVKFIPLSGMRSELKISEKAFVICRHGGMQTFDLPFVHHAVFDLLAKYSATQLEFIFLGTQVFENRDKTVKSNAHPQIHHLGTNTSIEYKENFIASCDAMLHARHGGETFGLAVAEFSIRNKPVITFPGSILYISHTYSCNTSCNTITFLDLQVEQKSTFTYLARKVLFTTMRRIFLK